MESQKKNGENRPEEIFKKMVAEKLPKLKLKHNSECATNPKHDLKKTMTRHIRVKFL